MHRRAPACPECQFVRPAPEIKQRTEMDGELQEFVRIFKLPQPEFIEAMKKASTLGDLQRLAKRQGYKNGWAWHKWTDRRKAS